MKKISFIISVIVLFPLLGAAQSLFSPDGNLELRFRVEPTRGTPLYSLTYKGKTVIRDSRLGYRLKPEYLFDEDFEVIDTRFSESDTVWQPVLGENRDIRDCHKEMFVAMRQKSTGWKLNLRFRIFNDGLGFRYEFPVQEELRHVIVTEESTEFRMTGDHKTFWIPGDYDTNEFQISTSGLSEIGGLIDEVRKEPLAAMAPTPCLAVQTPLMMKSSDGLYINIHEAGLVNYPAMHLALDDRNFVLSSHLAPNRNGDKVFFQTGHTSPWRTVVVSDDARDILASNLILNLNEPCRIDDTSWIKPVKYVGVWWEYFTGGGSTWAYSDTQDIIIGQTDYESLKPNGHHGANTGHVKDYIDFAAEHGFDAVLVEGWNEGWEDNYAWHKEVMYSFTKAYPDFDVEELQKYAESKGVSIIMHHETTSSVAEYERQMHDAFRFMNDYGYKAVKTGYVGRIIPRSEYHDSQWMINHYNRVAQTAADYRIMVNSHEAARPTGYNRTYPNWIAQESARGTEFESFKGNRPDHTTILPFTRLMGGPMDYTPGIFEGNLSVYGSNQAKLSTTLVKQLALYVTMYSPLQMAADLKENYEKHPDAFQFIKDVAADWDNSYILEAEPGDYITIARKAKGKEEWFVGAITDENSREARIDLGFLPEGKYMATIYADGKDASWDRNPKSYVISTRKVNGKTVLKQRLAPGGGCAISIRRL